MSDNDNTSSLERQFLFAMANVRRNLDKFEPHVHFAQLLVTNGQIMEHQYKHQR